MCFVFHVMSLPTFFTQIVHDHLLWSLPLGSTMTLCVHSPPFFCWTATLDPAEKPEGFLWVSSFSLYLLWWASRASYHASSLSMFIGALLVCGIRPQMGLLNSIMAGLGRPAPTGVDHICNKAKLVSQLISLLFLILCLTNLMHTSTWPLLWWRYDNVMDYWMTSFLWNFLRVSDVKFILASDAIFLAVQTLKCYLGCLYQAMHWQICCSLYNWELTVIIYLQCIEGYYY